MKLSDKKENLLGLKYNENINKETRNYVKVLKSKNFSDDEIFTQIEVSLLLYITDFYEKTTDIKDNQIYFIKNFAESLLKYCKEKENEWRYAKNCFYW